MLCGTVNSKFTDAVLDKLNVSNPIAVEYTVLITSFVSAFNKEIIVFKYVC